MRRIRIIVAVCQFMALGASAALAESRWALGGNAGISVGNQTEPAFGWWASAYRRLPSGLLLGLEGGRQRWLGDDNGGHIIVHDADILPNFDGLAHGGGELRHVSLSTQLNWRTPGLASGARLTIGVGGYQQIMHSSETSRDERDGVFRMGWSAAIGGGGMRGIAPDTEFRFDWIQTQPEPTLYFTAAFGVRLNL